MTLYETTFILNPQADDATLDRQIKTVVDLVTGNSGEIKHEDRIGTRRMAYEIEGMQQGNYTCIYYEAPADMAKILDRHFSLEESCIRHLTTVFEGDLEVIKEGAEPAGFGRPMGRGRYDDDDKGDDRRGRRDDRDNRRDRDDRPRRDDAPAKPTAPAKVEAKTESAPAPAPEASAPAKTEVKTESAPAPAPEASAPAKAPEPAPAPKEKPAVEPTPTKEPSADFSDDDEL